MFKRLPVPSLVPRPLPLAGEGLVTEEVGHARNAEQFLLIQQSFSVENVWQLEKYFEENVSDNGKGSVAG